MCMRIMKPGRDPAGTGTGEGPNATETITTAGRRISNQRWITMRKMEKREEKKGKEKRIQFTAIKSPS